VRIRIATRRSPLARWQANHVAALLQASDPRVTTELVSVDTAADRDQLATIRELGGKGAFSKEIQGLVLAGRADVAVHSAKDLQAVTPDGLVIGAFPERGTVEDCLVGSRLADLPSGATVATGSNRRRALLTDVRPDLAIVELRGNIGTRLGRLDEGGIDAIVLAAVALERLGERPPVVEQLDPETFVPQVGQGALAVECRPGDRWLVELLAAIDHHTTRLAVTAERSFLAELGGSCDLPAGAHAVVSSDGKLTIRGVLADPGDGAAGPRLRRAEVVELPGADPGRTLARRLRSGGPGEPDGAAG
jgi:hydroxymethylbilane synthase